MLTVNEILAVLLSAVGTTTALIVLRHIVKAMVTRELREALKQYNDEWDREHADDGTGLGSQIRTAGTPPG